MTLEQYNMETSRGCPCKSGWAGTGNFSCNNEFSASRKVFLAVIAVAAVNLMSTFHEVRTKVRNEHGE